MGRATSRTLPPARSARPARSEGRARDAPALLVVPLLARFPSRLAGSQDSRDRLGPLRLHAFTGGGELLRLGDVNVATRRGPWALRPSGAAHPGRRGSATPTRLTSGARATSPSGARRSSPRRMSLFRFSSARNRITRTPLVAVGRGGERKFRRKSDRPRPPLESTPSQRRVPSRKRAPNQGW